MDPTARALYDALRRIALYGPDQSGSLQLEIETDAGTARFRADAESDTGKAILAWHHLAELTLGAAQLELGRDPHLESRRLMPQASGFRPRIA
jgi:hypothetical protein